MAHPRTVSPADIDRILNEAFAAVFRDPAWRDWGPHKVSLDGQVWDQMPFDGRSR